MLMSIDQWLVFLAACTVLNTAPGPDTLYITARTITQGRLSGLISSFGVCTGAMVHATAAGAGLSVILATSAYAFTIVKWVGALFLIYLGVRAIAASLKKRTDEIKDDHGFDQNMEQASLWKVYIQGILVDVLNPKTALFFLAFIPQFINQTEETSAWPFIFLGLVVIANALVLEVIWIFFAARITKYLRTNERLSVWLERSLGVALIGIGLRLAKEKL